MKTKGTVFLVGAGPGDPQLLTLRGAELLRRADVVILDALASRELLRLVPSTAEVIERSRARDLSQEALNALMIERAGRGQTVVRLKGGDPYIFGRGGEEAGSLAKAGIPFEVVPGVSSITAVPNYAGIPLTHRDHCSSFTVITGHEDPAGDEGRIDWDRIAREPGTKVVLMGAERIERLAEDLQARGMSPTTPVAMVREGTTGRQRSVSGTLADISERAAQADLSAPAITVIGSVVNLRDRLNWFETRPLFGQRVVVTRARDQAEALSQPLRERGADVLEVPCLKFGPPSVREPLIEAMAGLGEYNWMVFTSANGVTVFFDLFFKAYKDLRDLGGSRIAAVGPATATKLESLHLQVDAMPKEYVGRQVAKAIAEVEGVENLRILLVRAETANPELVRVLEEQGAIVDDVPCYQTLAENGDWNGAAARLQEQGADWVTFASGSAVEHFHARFDLASLRRKFPGLKLASIGPETTKALAALSLQPEVEAKTHTMEGLVTALETARRRQTR